MTPTVVALVPGAEDAAAVQHAAAQAGAEVVSVGSAEDLAAAAAGAALVVVDLDAEGVLAVLNQLKAPTVGFLAEGRAEAVDAALAAGCEQVLPRSAFFRGLGRVLAAEIPR